jgi:hypothetical protein
LNNWQEWGFGEHLNNLPGKSSAAPVYAVDVLLFAQWVDRQDFLCVVATPTKQPVGDISAAAKI